MQTHFSLAQLADPAIKEADSILRSCVHCGFCTATCPTYVTLGNELDSPRGRIYLIKDMLENDRPADEQVVTHIDRCLSCLSCMTTCPSGVHYMHLVDHARVHIEKTGKRPFVQQRIRDLLAQVLPYRERFAAATFAAKFGKPFAGLFGMASALKPLEAMLKLAPASTKRTDKFTKPGTFNATGEKHGRVALLTGCAQPVLDGNINEATIELLTRAGVEVVLPEGEACCGSLVHHMGREDQAHGFAKHMIDVWTREMQKGLDAIVITTSGCGTTIKDYGHMFRNDADYADKAAAVSAIALDVTEYCAELDLGEPQRQMDMTVAYHSACSLQHGQQVKRAPRQLLEAAGFMVKDPPEGHLCCGSAGTYNILQPEIAAKLRDRKVANVESTNPDVIAAGNIGCLTQIGTGTDIPTVHTVKLLNWAYGGDMPPELASRSDARQAAE
ncbi:glycolate oxidase subunit GlcF [Ahrensia sp. R2A130]|uniref:glycolate oxidase subunit GlcF n=1 Tax=Ahrensia sp. R2A130 TaxID=744979 RepID=UPI0001E0945C|nr:glycolate oxidase subunit GlcF [Ahrensia sp. R2A130]EFL88537.1 glycolate oxidase, iron-sulfur subunit [Ahrensia sp. R2A130]